MATYERIADLEVEAHPLGAAEPPAWLTTAIADGTIEVVETDLKWRVGELTGWVDAVVGDYVVYTAQVSGPPLIPKSFALVKKDVFEATYEEAEA